MFSRIYSLASQGLLLRQNFQIENYEYIYTLLLHLVEICAGRNELPTTLVIKPKNNH